MRTLGQAIVDLGGKGKRYHTNRVTSSPHWRCSWSTQNDFTLRATFDGWIGGVAPSEDGIRLDELQEFTPSGVLDGALAVSEAFQHVRGRNALAGHRAVGFSLWNPKSTTSWGDDSDTGPELEWLPSNCWLIGLGHLGQANLWTLGFLPYANPETVQFILQRTPVPVAR